MISLTIDTSVFELPRKAKQLESFFLRIEKLYELEKDNFLTVSYMNNIPINLRCVKSVFDRKRKKYINGIDVNEIRTRLSNIVQPTKEECAEENIYEILIEKYIEKYIYKLKKICPNKPKEKRTKRKIGIYENIPERNKDLDKQYGNIRFNPNIYVNKPKLPILFNTFKKYLGYLAYLNDKYASEDVNYIVLGVEKGKKETKRVEVSMKNNKKTTVNVVGIDKMSADLPQEKEKKFESLDAVFEKPQRCFNQIDFGEDVNPDTFSRVLAPTQEEKAQRAQKVFLYLKTLNEIVAIINEKNTSGENIASDENIVELMNAHGLLCSPEDMAKGYSEFNCLHRTFDNGAKEKKLFNFHLKPVTTKREDKGSVRIYIAWDSKRKKMIVGWMAYHPPKCSDCPSIECPGNSLYPDYQRRILTENC